MPNEQNTTPRSRSTLQSTLAATFLALGTLALSSIAHADPFVGEVVCGGWNFCPANWGECNGQLQAIANNTTLFQLIGTTYGGDGQNTFALPNIQGRTVVGTGQGPSLSSRILGEAGGQESVTLTVNQIPIHNHSLAANDGAEKSASPLGRIFGVSPVSAKAYSSNASNVQLSSSAMSIFGGSQPHINLQPYLAVKCCISLFGIFPSQ
jgi:microcystin-dependent protein